MSGGKVPDYKAFPPPCKQDRKPPSIPPSDGLSGSSNIAEMVSTVLTGFGLKAGQTGNKNGVATAGGRGGISVSLLQRQLL